MFNSQLVYVGCFVRFLYHILILKKRITFLELWNKTKYNQNLDFIKLSNHNLGLITSIVITLFILMFIR